MFLNDQKVVDMYVALRPENSNSKGKIWNEMGMI